MKTTTKKPVGTIKKSASASASASGSAHTGISSTKNKKTKKSLDDPPVEQENEKELSEEEYI